MVNKELVEHSALRILENSIQGGATEGKIGVIAARKGTGKTASLVHIATDQLLQGKHVIHVSFSGRTDHIISWYEDIFNEITKKQSIDKPLEVHDELIKRRVILNFNQHGVTREQLLRSISALVDDGQFHADVIVVDGYDFRTGEPETLRVLRDFASERGITVWISASTRREDPEPDQNGVPALLKPFIDSIAIVITLAPEQGHSTL
jgi:KaiC/GvpD/RAD55 family RecA-like ATPase